MNIQHTSRHTLGWAALAIMGALFSPLAQAEAKTVNVELTAVETEVVIDGKGTKYNAWTYNGQVPGPVIRVTEGDTIHVTFKNLETNSRPHSIDFHAAETNFLVNYQEIRPGETKEFDWVAKRPGVFAYHCGHPQ